MVRMMSLWNWRVRRGAKVITDEAKVDAERIERGSDEWRRWWRDTGERELRCILMTAWDPIGVGDVPEAWDEYDSYVLGVGGRLLETEYPDAAVASVAEYLDHVERDFMEAWTPVRGRANADLADSLVAWYEWSFLRGGRPPQTWIDNT
jgi:hypothetical protein